MATLQRLAGQTAKRLCLRPASALPIRQSSTPSIQSAATRPRAAACFSTTSLRRYAQAQDQQPQGTVLIPVDESFTPSSRDPYMMKQLEGDEGTGEHAGDGSIAGRKIRHYTVNSTTLLYHPPLPDDAPAWAVIQQRILDLNFFHLSILTRIRPRNLPPQVSNMLSRAALRLVQPAAVSRWASAAPTRRALPALASASTIWSRGMAKDNKPNSRFGAPTNANSRPSNTQQKAPSPSTPRSAPSEPGKVAPEQRKAVEPEAAKSVDQAADESAEVPEKEIPLSELPDLTQGIPSTFAYEQASAREKAALEAVEEDAPTSAGGGRGKGELPASAYISSTEKRRQRFANYMFAASLAGMISGVVYLGRNWDEDEERKHPEVPNGWGLGLWWNRASTRMSEVLTYYHEPAFEKLLPDPDPMFERPYTLCISLEDMLVHSEWTREHGWRLAKRPGADYFLHYLSQYYELVLFTSVPFAMGEPLVRKLDPYRFIVWPLYREATKYKDGEIIKDLAYLNRDLSKVIMIDTNQQHVRAQPENAIVLPKWTGDPKDKDLVSLIPFLEYIHTMQYKDVRKVLKSFEGKHIPTEFARREAIARAEFNKQLEAERKKHPHRGKSGMAALGGLFGLKPQNLSVMVMPEGEQDPATAFAQGKMLQDIARERGQKNYEDMEKMIRENGEKWLKEEAALQEAAQKEAMNSMKTSFTGWFTPSPGDGGPEKKQ